MASIKASNVGELIGTFEDSAAVAGSIVIEEYIAQLIEETVQQRALCQPTKEGVQAFTRELLIGFNWQIFKDYFPLDTVDKVNALPDKITTMVFDEFVSTQPRSFDMEAHRADLEKWIRSAVVIPFFTDTGAIRKGSSAEAAQTGSHQTAEGMHSRVDTTCSNNGGAAQSSPRIRLSVKANPVHGNPAYKLHFATTLEDGHRIKASVGGLDSKAKAKATIAHLSNTLEHHAKRSKGMLRSPCPPPPIPGPQPMPRPSPPRDPNDPYDSMYAFVFEHFNDYRQRRWESAVANYSSWKVAMAQGLEWAPRHKRRRRCEDVESLQDDSEKKR
ncbi:unnamed protein product [Phytophthora fragariaefolia]|uniref:Unnamed protein product n=1 Tax=Phytophthora fragariaefolia TaxID=1490495 RepID=A0A9W6XXF6_9STRA|nr:unnamed protein product [Phytophthora fragariaefolia]